MSEVQERHILGISGGRDSAALAVHMRQTQPDLPIEYFFTDTGKELAEVYTFLDRLEGFLGEADRPHQPGPRFRFLAKRIQSLPSFAAHTLVHAAA